MFIFSFLFLISTLVKSPAPSDIPPLRTDFYQTLSVPRICMVLAHHNPSGPRYLYTKFIYKRQSNISQTEIQNNSVEYSFKRVDTFCESSVIFTTLGKDFKKLDIIIIIYLAKGEDYIAIFEYTFYTGFKADIYQLKNTNDHYTINVKVIDSSIIYLKSHAISDNNTASYLKSITEQDGQLCLITPNNRAVILNPDYIPNAPSGLITGFQAKIFQDGIYIDKFNFPAYSCLSDITYPDMHVIFFINKPNLDVKFKVIYRKFYYDAPVSMTMKFRLPNPIFDDINNFKKTPEKYKKVLLTRLYFDHVKYPNNTIVIDYFSKDNKVYYTRIIQRIKIYRLMESTREYFQFY